MLLGQVEHAGDHAGALHRVRGSQGTELATSTLLVLDSGYFSGEAHLGYHQDTHLGARGALSTLRVLSWNEKAVDKARKVMGKPGGSLHEYLNKRERYMCMHMTCTCTCPRYVHVMYTLCTRYVHGHVTPVGELPSLVYATTKFVVTK